MVRYSRDTFDRCLSHNENIVIRFWGFLKIKRCFTYHWQVTAFNIDVLIYIMGCRLILSISSAFGNIKKEGRETNV